MRTKYYKDILYQLAELDSREFISKGQHCTSAYLKTIHLCLNKHFHLGQSQQRHIGQKRQHKEEIKQGKEKNVIYPQNEDGNRCESSKRGKITLSVSIEDRFGAAYLWDHYTNDAKVIVVFIHVLWNVMKNTSFGGKYHLEKYLRNTQLSAIFSKHCLPALLCAFTDALH